METVSGTPRFFASGTPRVLDAAMAGRHSGGWPSMGRLSHVECSSVQYLAAELSRVASVEYLDGMESKKLPWVLAIAGGVGTLVLVVVLVVLLSGKSEAELRAEDEAEAKRIRDEFGKQLDESVRKAREKQQR